MDQKRPRGRPRIYQTPEEAKQANRASIKAAAKARRLHEKLYPGVPYPGKNPNPRKTAPKQPGRGPGRPRKYQYDYLLNKQAYMRFIQYGVTPEMTETILQHQDYKCAICRKDPTPGRVLHCDHDHNTGAVRGYLCSKCNFGLHFLENAEFMEKATKYLEHHL
jgi:hypothetical protein